MVGGLVLGNGRAFAVPPYALESLWEFLLYGLLGVLAAGVAVAYTRLIYWCEDRFSAARRIPEWARPAAGGACLGALALLYGLFPGLGYERVPHVFGVGYEVIERGLLGELGLGLMAALVGLKVLATALTLGSGGSGGVFAPALFVGAMLGGSLGGLAHRAFPELVAQGGGYALVGMAAVFAGASHAPITAILILFEMTGDYRIILPLMVTVVVSAFLARRWLGGESIYTLKLARRGVRLAQGRDVDVMDHVRVEEVMARDVRTISADATLAELTELSRATRDQGFPVLDGGGQLAGIVTAQDLRRAVERGLLPDTRVGAVATREVVVAYPDETVAAALRRLSVRGVGRLPVVSRQDPAKLLGLIRREEMIRAYDVAVARRAARLDSSGGRGVRKGASPPVPAAGGDTFEGTREMPARQPVAEVGRAREL